MTGHRVLTRDLVYQAIRDSIITGELLPGSRVTETMLANQFGMSRTPLREALHRLEAEELILRQPNGSLLVSTLDSTKLSEIFDINERLEGILAAQAARVRSSELVHRLEHVLRQESVTLTVLRERSTHPPFCQTFHDALWEMSERHLTVKLLEGVQGLFHRYNCLAPKTIALGEREAAIHSEHQLIAQAIGEGDPVWAEMAMKSHLRESKKFLLAAYKSR